MQVEAASADVTDAIIQAVTNAGYGASIPGEKITQNKEQKPQQNNMMVVSAAPETLDDDLADMESVEPSENPAPSREVAMLDSEEAQHKKKQRHHPDPSDKNRRNRSFREKDRHSGHKDAEPSAQ